jgi:hypothetical protein
MIYYKAPLGGGYVIMQVVNTQYNGLIRSRPAVREEELRVLRHKCSVRNCCNWGLIGRYERPKGSKK